MSMQQRAYPCTYSCMPSTRLRTRCVLRVTAMRQRLTVLCIHSIHAQSTTTIDVVDVGSHWPQPNWHGSMGITLTAWMFEEVLLPEGSPCCCPSPACT